ncbi:hypothetical protein ANN_21162 [Periplaneta americana]|uniref:RING-type domain-containing protein n=1 Tax=Periplaneta americana TaxID=6978 RepID=A0ABQ8SEL2_PERAM|nr:hypothetical protein ANN_21162 [Periplaneta americana]
MEAGKEEQRGVVRFLTAEGVGGREIHRRVSAAYDERSMSYNPIMDTLAQELLQGLECPVCFDYMVPPITLCENGHNICKICKPKLFECPTCKGWEGLLEELEEHIRKTHNTGDFIRDATGKYTDITPKMRRNCSWAQVVFTLGEIFFLHVVTTDIYLFAYILHVGNVNNAKKYKYRMTFKTRDGCDSFTTCRVTQSYLDDIVSIRRTENCAVLSYKFIERCMGEDREVPIECEILKVD